MNVGVAVKEVAEGFSALVATRAFGVGETVLTLSGPILSHPTRTSIEIDAGHIECSLGEPTKFVSPAPDLPNNYYSGRYVNHSSSPNCQVDRARATLFASRDIASGDEITFDYNVNETKVACPFIDSVTRAPVLGRVSSHEQQTD